MAYPRNEPKFDHDRAALKLHRAAYKRAVARCQARDKRVLLIKRRLYDDETLIAIQRPMMITAIPDALRAGDVLRRTIVVQSDWLRTTLAQRDLERLKELDRRAAELGLELSQ